MKVGAWSPENRSKLSLHKYCVELCIKCGIALLIEESLRLLSLFCLLFFYDYKNQYYALKEKSVKSLKV